MSLLVIDDMVEALGYSEMFMNYYYKIPNMDICDGLKLIQSDADVQKMCNFIPKARVLDIYIEELSVEEASPRNNLLWSLWSAPVQAQWLLRN
ncbi:hypothetical protein TB2_037672 [Malus domestica]